MCKILTNIIKLRVVCVCVFFQHPLEKLAGALCCRPEITWNLVYCNDVSIISPISDGLSIFDEWALLARNNRLEEFSILYSKSIGNCFRLIILVRRRRRKNVIFSIFGRFEEMR